MRAAARPGRRPDGGGDSFGAAADGRASDDAVRRPDRRQRRLLRRREEQDHRHHRPERRGQDHGLQLHHRLLQPDGRPPRAARRRPRLPARAHGRLPDRAEGAGGADLPEHPPVSQHERAGEPAGGAAQRADARIRHDPARPARRAELPPRRAGRDRIRALLARPGGADQRRRPRRRHAALWRAAPAGDRARHVHPAVTALPGRAGGRPQQRRIA